MLATVTAPMREEELDEAIAEAAEGGEAADEATRRVGRRAKPPKTRGDGDASSSEE